MTFCKTTGSRQFATFQNFFFYQHISGALLFNSRIGFGRPCASSMHQWSNKDDKKKKINTFTRVFTRGLQKNESELDFHTYVDRQLIFFLSKTYFCWIFGRLIHPEQTRTKSGVIPHNGWQAPERTENSLTRLYIC